MLRGVWCKLAHASSRRRSPATPQSSWKLCTEVSWAIKKCHLFVFGLTTFQVITGHKPLIPILNGTTVDEIDNPRLQRLKMKMGEVGSFVAIWVPGSQHTAADVLSRIPTALAAGDDECGEDHVVQDLQSTVVAELCATDKDLRSEEVKNATSTDPKMQMLIGNANILRCNC